MRQRRRWFDLDDGTLSAPRIALLGMPYDGAVSLRAGAAAAPERIRAISRTSDPISRRGLRVSVPLRDYGDAGARGTTGQPLSQLAWMAFARSRLRELPADAFQLVIGGDNSVSIPSIEAFAQRHGGDVGILWFDAHPDLFEAYDGNPDSHACALRRSMANGGDEWEAGIVSALHRLRRAVERNPETIREGAAAFDELHKAFHRALLAACGSERLLALHDDLYLQAYRYRRVMMRQFTDAAWFMAEHQDLADVVIARRTEDAVRKLTDHLNSTLAVVYEQGTGGAL